MTAVYTGLQYEDSVNLAALREDIYYLGKVNAGFISESDLSRIVNKYYAQVQEVIRAVNENFYMVIATADLALMSVNQGSYTYPDGSGGAPPYEKLKSVWVALNPANRASPQVDEYERCNVADPGAISDPAYQFTQPTVLPFGTFFTLLPYLTDATLYPVTNGIKVYYIASQLKLVNPTDVPLIFPSFHDAIVHGALIDVAQRKGDYELKASSIATFKSRLEDIKSYASNHLPQEVGVVEGQENAGGWMYPWGRNDNLGL